MPALIAGAILAVAGASGVIREKALHAAGEDATPSRSDDARQLGGEASPLTSSYVSTYEIVREFNHDPDGTRSFTQGLEFHPDGTLYESVGLYGKSHVRSINLHPDGTMEVLAKAKNQNHIFAEGIAIDGDNIYQVTWKEKVRSGCRPPSHSLPSAAPPCELVLHDLQLTVACLTNVRACRC